MFSTLMLEPGSAFPDGSGEVIRRLMVAGSLTCMLLSEHLLSFFKDNHIIMSKRIPIGLDLIANKFS